MTIKNNNNNVFCNFYFLFLWCRQLPERCPPKYYTKVYSSYVDETDKLRGSLYFTYRGYVDRPENTKVIRQFLVFFVSHITFCPKQRYWFERWRYFVLFYRDGKCIIIDMKLCNYKYYKSVVFLLLKIFKFKILLQFILT